MKNLIGQTLSHYRINAAIGAGGMGEVYRATDTNLDRDVAIKVLPPEVARDPGRLERFRREAHLLAALNHPHIAAIYGLEETEGKPFLALELVEGEDLRERLDGGPIPLDEALEIAEQIAEALEEAHNKGIVHRDLKPANVKITPKGQAKVLDFGLAKAWAADSVEESSPQVLSHSPTVVQAGTMPGVILGTAAYMSPEQARGRPVDKRTDIWSFGVLLWEMLTGRALFSGTTATDVMAAVVKEEPDLDALPAQTPPAARRLIERCLRKDPRTRLPDISAARLELQDLRRGGLADPAATLTAGALAAEHASRRRERLIWAAITAAVVACAAALGWTLLTSAPEPRPPTRFAVDTPEGWLLTGEFSPPQVSPDGRSILFKAWPEDQPGTNDAAMLWIRSLEALEARPLAGTEGIDGAFFWSPDGRSIAFTVPGELRRLSLSDGTVDRICSLPVRADDGQWHENGTIYISVGGLAAVIQSVPASGGEAKVLTRLDTEGGEIHHHFVQLLPDGKRFLFAQWGSGEDVSGLVAASLEDPDERHWIAPGWNRWLYSQGRLLVVRDGTLLAQPFDADRLETTGDPVAIASSVASWSLAPDVGWFDASPAGTLAYFSGDSVSDEVQLAWVDREGRQLGTLGAPGRYGQIALSPDERSVALEISEREGSYDIWVMDVARGVTSRVTATPGAERDPVWSPDSRSLAFVARRAEGVDLRRKGLELSDPETVLADSPDDDIPESWSRDGELLTVRRTAADEQSVWALPLEGGRDARPVLATGFRVDEPQVSPDGRWLAYVSPESGRDEVYLQPFRGEGDRVRVSVEGGGQPKWRSDGRELFYTEPGGMLIAVEIRSQGGRLEVSPPSELFEIPVLQGTGYDDYAVASDGRRFLVKLRLEEDREHRLHIITDWTSLLD